MPSLSKEKRGGGLQMPRGDVHAGQLYTEARMSSTRCTVCQMRLVDVLADAGETTHPACAGWPPGVRRSSAARSARASVARKR